MAQAYTAPTWTDGSGEGISASNLQSISNTLQGIVQGTDKAIHNISINGSTITFTFVDGTIETAQAVDLKGISSIAKTSTLGNVDTYTITYSDGTTSTFYVTNGRDGAIQYTEGTNIHIDNENVISTYNVFAQDDPDVSDMNDTDLMPLSRNAYTKVITWSNIKAKLKTYFDGLYGAITSIATNEPNATASQAYAAGEHFYKNGKFCTAKAAIASGATFTLGTNYTEGTVADDTIYYVDVSVAGQAITSYSNDLQIYYGSKAIDGLPANAYGVGWCWAKDRYWEAVNIVLVNDDDAPYITLGFFHPSSYTIRDRQEMVIRVFYKIINY